MRGENEFPTQELDEKTLLKRIMVRPGLYVGANRLDYIQHFVAGYMFGRIPNATLSEWDDNHELQLWIFRTQGVVLHTDELKGWTLFYRCYGISHTALGQFAKMLHADISSLCAQGTLDREVSVANEVGELHRHMRFSDGPKSTVEEMKAELINTLRALIMQQCTNCDEARVYIWKDKLYTQLRYVFHTPDGWQDDLTAIADPENHRQFVRLHALIQCCPHEEMPWGETHNFPLYLYPHGKNDTTWNDILDMKHEIKDEETLWYHFQQWKTRFTASY